MIFMKHLSLIKKILIFQIPIIIVAFMGWSLRGESDFFKIKEVPIEVEFAQDQSALIESLKPKISQSLNALKGVSIWKVSLKDVQKNLLSNSWIEQVELHRTFPNKISAFIRFVPISFLFVDNKNRIFPVTENGVKLGKTKPTLVPVAPILRNNNIMKDEAILKKMISLLDEVPSIGDLKKENRGSINYSQANGLTLTLIAGEEIVHFGEVDISTKALQILRVLDYLKSQKQKARVIDASFTKKVLVRPRKRS
jgi:cell division septal protein FtsQ